MLALSPYFNLCELNEHRDAAKRNRGGVRAIQKVEMRREQNKSLDLLSLVIWRIRLH